MKPVIERLGPSDHLRAKTIRLRALRDAPDAFWVTAEQEEHTPEDAWRARLTAADAATFVARAGGADVGLAVGSPHHHHDGDAGLYSMWVAPDARGAGVGTQLVVAVIAWARERGFRSLRLDVADDNEPALRLYERLGFIPTGAVHTMPPPRNHITEHERILELTRS